MSDSIYDDIKREMLRIDINLDIMKAQHEIDTHSFVKANVAKFKIAKQPDYIHGLWTPLILPDIQRANLIPNLSIYNDDEKEKKVMDKVIVTETGKYCKVGNHNVDFDTLRKVFIRMLMDQGTMLDILERNHTFLSMKIKELHDLNPNYWLKYLCKTAQPNRYRTHKDLSLAYPDSFHNMNKKWNTWLVDLAIAKEKDFQIRKARRLKKLKDRWLKDYALMVWDQFIHFRII